MKIYIAASSMHLHAVRLFQRSLKLNQADIEILDWTELVTLSEALSPSQYCGEINANLVGQMFRFCEEACGRADLVVYFGQSGQNVDRICPSQTLGASGDVSPRSEEDAIVEVGLARAAGVPVLGILDSLKLPGLMLHGAVSLWARDISDACERITLLAHCLRYNEIPAECCASCPSEKICVMAPAEPDFAK